MSEGPEFAQNQLKIYLSDRDEILSEITRLEQGDSSGMCLISKKPDGRVLPEGERIVILLNEKINELSAVELRINDFCGNFRLMNPLK